MGERVKIIRGGIPKTPIRFGSYADLPEQSVAPWHLIQALFPGLTFQLNSEANLCVVLALGENDGEKLPNANLNMGHGNGIDVDTVDTKHASDFVLKDAGYIVFSKDIKYDDSSPQLIVQAHDGWIVKDVWVKVTTVWDTETSVVFKIGNSLTNDGFFDAVVNMNLLATGYGGYELDQRGSFLWDSVNSHVRQYVVSTDLDLSVYLNEGDAKQGAATVYLGIVRIK